MKEIITSPGAPPAIGPYSQAVKIGAGALLFCSGQVPIDPATGTIVEGTIGVQTRQVMENLKAVLKAGGCGLTDVVKITVYLIDLAEFTEMNQVYGSYFADNFPARSTVEVKALPRGARIEMDAIAAM